ncbi:MAG: signal peptidase II [Candidatus Krumholzibacteria bacterium]|nr:signal peptidase II [Candidatus Krumholzibacteria bacterium]
MGLLLPATVVVVIDQLTKQLVWRHGQNYDVIAGYLHITLVKNSGAAFGLFQGGRAVFVVASLLAAAFIVYAGRRVPRVERYKRALLGCILGGAIGNLIDRMISGEVIDFIQIGVAGHYWPVFNVADIGVSVGAALLLLHVASSRQRDAVDRPPGAA